MVLLSVMLVVLLANGVSIPGIFLILALLNIAVAACIYTMMPEFLRRFAAWCRRRSTY